MNYESHSQKKPFLLQNLSSKYLKELDRSASNLEKSNISIARSPNTIRNTLSPRQAREYLNSLKNFVASCETRKHSTSTIKRVDDILLYCTRPSDQLKLVTPSKVEITKMHANGSVQSVRYFYLENPVLSNPSEVLNSPLINILGMRNSGRKALLLEILHRLSIKQFNIAIHSKDACLLNTTITTEAKQLLKSLLAPFKNQRISLIIKHG